MSGLHHGPILLLEPLLYTFRASVTASMDVASWTAMDAQVKALKKEFGLQLPQPLSVLATSLCTLLYTKRG